jgi:hypothetical protein
MTSNEFVSNYICVDEKLIGTLILYSSTNRIIYTTIQLYPKKPARQQLASYAPKTSQWRRLPSSMSFLALLPTLTSS